MFCSGSPKAPNAFVRCSTASSPNISRRSFNPFSCRSRISIAVSPASTESVPFVPAKAGTQSHGPWPLDSRLRGNERSLSAERAATLRFQDVSRRIIDNLKVEVEAVNWFATYHTHHRVTEHFRKGRAFLLGDAAHIHSPAGGQGMNTGIGDAINLAWKLKAVLAGHARDDLLDTYEIERIAFARLLVQTTDRVFTLATAEGKLADLIRTRIA